MKGLHTMFDLTPCAFDLKKKKKIYIHTTDKDEIIQHFQPNIYFFYGLFI